MKEPEFMRWARRIAREDGHPNMVDLVASHDRLRAALSQARVPHSRECISSKEWQRGVDPGCDCGVYELMNAPQMPG